MKVPVEKKMLIFTDLFGSNNFLYMKLTIYFFIHRDFVSNWIYFELSFFAELLTSFAHKFAGSQLIILIFLNYNIPLNSCACFMKFSANFIFYKLL